MRVQVQHAKRNTDVIKLSCATSAGLHLLLFNTQDKFHIRVTHGSQIIWLGGDVLGWDPWMKTNKCM